MLEPVTFIPNEELPSEPKLACVLKTNIKKIPILASTPFIPLMRHDSHDNY
ncbi:hypothetical protein HCC13_07915 [Streptococcus suis]|nr:hypothetical protein [Streptococcus suis]